MNEKIFIKKDSYLNIQKSESDGKINITIEPVIEFNPKDGDFVTIYVARTIEYSDECITNKLIGISKGDLDIGYHGFPVYAGIAMDGYLYINCVLENNVENVVRESTETEKNELLNMLKKAGKRWNAEKLCIEDIPERKFKKGDKVRIKDGISSKTHRWDGAHFMEQMDGTIGKTLTVVEYSPHGNVYLEDSLCEFSEDWLEPVSDELKVGDLVIAWNSRGNEIISTLDVIDKGTYKYLVANQWHKNALKWDGTKEQLEKVRRGEL